MSSRVVSYKLDASQRARLQSATRTKARERANSRRRERAALQAQLGSLQKVARVTTLPRASEVDDAFNAADGVDAPLQSVRDRIAEAARAQRVLEVAELAEHLGDRVTSTAVQQILQQLPAGQSLPDDVMSLVSEIEANPTERAGLLDELRDLISAANAEATRSRHAREKLDRIHALSEILDDPTLRADAVQAEQAFRNGDLNAVSTLALRCEDRLGIVLREEEAQAILNEIAALWTAQGYHVAKVADRSLIAYLDKDVTATRIELNGNTAQISQAAIEGSSATIAEYAASMSVHCRAADAVDKSAQERGLAVTRFEVTDPSSPPTTRVSVPGMAFVGNRTAEERARRVQPEQARPLGGGS